MSDDRLYELWSRWAVDGSGAISALEFNELKDEYLSQLGASTCTSCPDWRQDMFVHFRSYLKGLNKNVYLMQTTKFIIDPKFGSIHLPGEGKSIVNRGGVGTVLTDEIAETLLAKNPELSEFIIKNPDYSEATGKAAAAPGTPPATKPKTAAQLKKEKAAADAEAALELKKKDEAALVAEQKKKDEAANATPPAAPIVPPANPVTPTAAPANELDPEAELKARVRAAAAAALQSATGTPQTPTA